jgi:hypothetical protein
VAVAIEDIAMAAVVHLPTEDIGPMDSTEKSWGPFSPKTHSTSTKYEVSLTVIFFIKCWLI